MCGFLGVIGDEACSRMSFVREFGDAFLSNRGPDASGSHEDHDFSIFCARLVIRGGAAGQQPVVLPGRKVLAYNGEIYRIAGTVLSAVPGDTALLALHLEAGKPTSDLDGMFAMAFWDPNQRELLLARDHFGVKPLYCSTGTKVRAFGSSALSIGRLLGLEEIEISAALAWLSLRGPFADAPFLKGVHPVPPGYELRLRDQDGQITETSSKIAPAYPWRVASDRIARLEEELVAAVETCLSAEVEVGLCLSGGVDSSLIAAIATSIAGPKIPAYVLSSATNQDDVQMALGVASTLGIGARVVSIVDEWPSILEELIPLLDEPPTTESTVGVAAMAKAANSDGVRVLLSGEGADELFGGYDEYRQPFDLVHILREMDWLRTNVRPEHRTAVETYIREVDGRIEGIVDPGRFDRSSRLARLLRRFDAATMAYSVEGRVPYLVRGVLEAAESWTWDQRTAGIGKWPLREVARRWLPPAVADRPKQPFASGVRRSPSEIRGFFEKYGDNLRPLLTDIAIAELATQSDSPQAWKAVAVASHLAVHGLHICGTS